MHKASTLPYGWTRNRQAKKKQFDCQGEVKVSSFCKFNLWEVYFLQTAHAVYCDIAVEFYHTVYPGRTQFGVPLKVREWIQKNPRSRPFAQWEELLLAIKRVEIPGIQLNSHFLCPSLIHYWWRKTYGKTAYISDDPWENAAHILREHPFVQSSPSSFELIQLDE